MDLSESSSMLTNSNDANNLMEVVVSHQLDQVLEEYPGSDEEEQKVSEITSDTSHVLFANRKSSIESLENPFVCVITLFIKAIILVMYFLANFFQFKLPWQIILLLIIVVDFVTFNIYSAWKLIGAKWVVQKPSSSIIDIFRIYLDPKIEFGIDKETNTLLDISVFILSLLIHYIFVLVHFIVIVSMDDNTMFIDIAALSLNVINSVGFFFCYKERKRKLEQRRSLRMKLVSNSLKRTTAAAGMSIGMLRHSSINL